MNAPAAQTDITSTSAYKFIALDDIIPSQTHIQQLRRARFDPAAMAELVASVTAHGVLQPIVVRANIAGIEASEDATPWEIVTGERRWMAARVAKLVHVPAITRELSDLQVIEIQLIENLQREGLHPLEEAEGFADLIHLKGVTANEIADTIGRSRSHVCGRLKLLDLIPAAREAFNAGKIDLSKAQLIARIPVPKLQAKALKNAQTPDWRGDAISFRDFKHGLENNKFVVELKNAAFRMADATLLVAAGSCIDCPKRTGNLGDLFVDVKDPDVCTDPDCFGKKMALHQKRLRANAESSGRTVISGDAAKAIRNHVGDLTGYIDLDEESEEEFTEREPDNQPDDGRKTPEYIAWEQRMEAFTPRTYRQMLGDALSAESIVLLDDGKKLREIIPVPIAKTLLKHHGITLPAWMSQKPKPAVDPIERKEQEEKQHERQERETEFRRALLVQIHTTFKGPLKPADLMAIAEAVMEHTYGDSILVDTCYGGKDIELEEMNESQLNRLLAELTVTECVVNISVNPAPLLALAKRCKIDPGKVRKDLATAAKAKMNPAPAKKTAAKKSPAAKKPSKKSHQ